MADLTLSGNKVDDANALEGLQKISESERLRKLHNGDKDFTESELGAILDIAHPEEGVIDGGDQITHAILEKTGLTEQQFVALAKEYHSRFPVGKKKVNTSLWAPRPKRDNSNFDLPTGFRTSASTYCPETSDTFSLTRKGAVKNPSEVILISGYGGDSFDAKSVEQLSANLSKQSGIAKFTAIGNGNSPVDISAIRAVIQRAKKENRPVTLFINMYGDVKAGRHHIMIADDKWIPTSELFQIIKLEAGNDVPVSIFMTSCHGGAAVTEANTQLPEGVSIVALAPSAETVAGQDVERLVSTLGSNNVDLNGNNWPEDIEILYLYLTKSLQNRIAPRVALVGRGELDLNAELRCRLGKTFETDERKHIHARLDPILGKGTVDEIIAKIEGAQSEWSIPAIEFGKALAVILAIHDDRK